jgi:hypothetical protein
MVIRRIEVLETNVFSFLFRVLYFIIALSIASLPLSGLNFLALPFYLLPLVF